MRPTARAASGSTTPSVAPTSRTWASTSSSSPTRTCVTDPRTLRPRCGGRCTSTGRVRTRDRQPDPYRPGSGARMGRRNPSERPWSELQAVEDLLELADLAELGLVHRGGERPPLVRGGGALGELGHV